MTAYIDPPRHTLAHTPTPLERLRYALGDYPLWCKRDDATGTEVSGNKVRKLEYLVADALQRGATALITCGGEQSNHARATAMVAARLGLACHLILRTADPTRPPAPTGNILLNLLAGAHIHWISFAAWRERDAHMAKLATTLQQQGEAPYVFGAGGSNALGSMGYVRASLELVEDFARVGLAATPPTIVYACGSGGTGAGLLVGCKLSGHLARGGRVVGVNVCDDKPYFVREIGGIAQHMHLQFQTPRIAEAEIAICDQYVGRGYALSQTAELAALAALARTDGIVLDPVYTGKAFYALTQELGRSQPSAAAQALFGPPGTPIVFMHTGGLFGAFAAPALAEYTTAALVRPT